MYFGNREPLAGGGPFAEKYLLRAQWERSSWINILRGPLQPSCNTNLMTLWVDSHLKQNSLPTLFISKKVVSMIVRVYGFYRSTPNEFPHYWLVFCRGRLQLPYKVSLSRFLHTILCRAWVECKYAYDTVWHCFGLVHNQLAASWGKATTIRGIIISSNKTVSNWLMPCTKKIALYFVFQNSFSRD